MLGLRADKVTLFRAKGDQHRGYGLLNTSFQLLTRPQSCPNGRRQHSRFPAAWHAYSNSNATARPIQTAQRAQNPMPSGNHTHIAMSGPRQRTKSSARPTVKPLQTRPTSEGPRSDRIRYWGRQARDLGAYARDPCLPLRATSLYAPLWGPPRERGSYRDQEYTVLRKQVLVGLVQKLTNCHDQLV